MCIKRFFWIYYIFNIIYHFLFFYNYENYRISESLTNDNLLLYFIYIINSCVLNFFIFKITKKYKTKLLSYSMPFK